MNPYLAILKARAITLFQYRGTAFAGLTTQLFWGGIKVMIFGAFYTQATAVLPISYAQAVAFIWLGQALLQVLPWTIDKELEALVKNGNVSYELIRPLDLYWLWYSRAFAMRTIPTLMRCLPVFIIAGLFFGLSLPPSWNATLAFGISLVLGAFLASAVTTLIIISLFWTISGEGILRLMPHMTLLLSGLILPLPLFPDWLQPFLSLQPLRGILDLPCRFYTGVIAVEEIFYYLGFQLAWTLILIGLGKFLMKKAMKQFMVLGG